MEGDRTPPATKLALVGVLVLTATLLLVLPAAAGSERADPRATGLFLVALTALFALRVVGQLVVRTRAPRFLPPTEDWNLMPYRLLLPIQVAFLAVMAIVCAALLRDEGRPADPSPGFGRAAVALATIYAGAMVVRYAVRMARRPEERWFGGTIPIVFHLVLASYVFVLGGFHASY